MNKDRWQEVKTQIKENFSVSDEYIEDLEPGQAEVLEFESPQGLLMARFVSRPKVLDKKTTYSNRVGGDIKVDYVYSDKEVSEHLEIYTWSESANDWQKLDNTDMFS